MAIGAEMSLESPTSPPRKMQVVLGNMEINDRCSYTVACGATCYLNRVHTNRPVLAEDKILESAKAMIGRGDVIRHLAVVGKEAFESARLLLKIAREFHKTSPSERPASLGVISASASGIKKWLPEFADSPLSWLAVSVDVAKSGLRAGDPFSVLKAALAGKSAGGTLAVAVNTTFRKETVDDVLGLSCELKGTRIKQWALCPLVLPLSGRMHSTVGIEQMERMIRGAGQVVDVAERVVIETDPATLRTLLGESIWRTVSTHVWRIEYLLPNGVWLFARSPEAGYFIRQRYDGALLSRLDFSRLGVTEGRYGQFRSGADIDIALKTMETERAVAEADKSVRSGDKLFKLQKSLVA
jgi:hypothetical protein